MLLSINWLKDFIPIDIPVNDIADKLTMSGIEVEAITNFGHQWNNIVVGEILEISSHPNADKLSLTKIKAGQSIYSVVCGAPNISKGFNVALALEGAQLKNGLKIKRSKIRGELSDGMLCSESELELGYDNSGIMILSADLKHGTPLAEALNLSDTIIDLGITPNRSDCLSVIGMAREIAAIFKTPLNIPDIYVVENKDKTEDILSVEIIASDLCPRYTARYISNVKVSASPFWMKRRLESCGIRSINNIVDITNYVLLEWGQPLHAFDINMIHKNKIIVRRAYRDEKFIALDEIERNLTGDVLLICDEEKPVAIGGIMGGLNSGITSKTTGVILESAYFNPSSIARSSRALQLKTEASQRFEKGVDIQGVIPALNKAALLMKNISGGEIYNGHIDRYPNPLSAAKPIMLSINKTNSTIGIDLESHVIKDILERLYVKTSEKGRDIIEAVPPSFRYDLCEPIDLIEEVARINGYDKIPATYPKADTLLTSFNKSFFLSSLIRDILISQGFHEVINYSFISIEILNQLNLPAKDLRSNPVTILNPLSSSQSVLRTTMIPSLLLNLRENIKNKCNTVKIFEISNVFIHSQDNSPPVESKRMTGLISGYRYGELWNLQQNEIDFFDIKGSVETILECLRINNHRFGNEVIEPYFNPNKMLNLLINDDYIGSFGEVHPDILENYEIEKNVCIFDLDFDLISMYFSDKATFSPFSRYPSIYRDIALVVDENIPAEKVYDTIKSFKNNLINDVKIFDYYKGRGIPAGKKSLAYRIKFQSFNGTLTDSEINIIHDEILSYLKNKLGAELRN